MKIVAMIPFWSGYMYPTGSLGRRDIVKLGGRPLINYTVHLANHVEMIDQVVIYSSNDQVMSLLDDSAKCSYLKREEDLDGQNVSIESIIERFVSVYDADIIVLMHPKSPFLKPESIADCISKVKSKEYDSAFLVTKARKLAWYKGKPLNYLLNTDTPNLGSIASVVLESSSVYVFTKELFQRTRHRIGENPYMKEVGHFEGFEIDRLDDFEMAELIVNAGFEINGA